MTGVVATAALTKSVAVLPALRFDEAAIDGDVARNGVVRIAGKQGIAQGHGYLTAIAHASNIRAPAANACAMQRAEGNDVTAVYSCCGAAARMATSDAASRAITLGIIGGSDDIAAVEGHIAGVLQRTAADGRRAHVRHVFVDHAHAVRQRSFFVHGVLCPPEKAGGVSCTPPAQLC